MQMRCDVICHVTALDQSEPSLLENKMTASIGRSRDMQMRCDVIGHVTALDQSEHSTLNAHGITHLSAPCGLSALDQSEPSTLGHVTAFDHQN